MLKAGITMWEKTALFAEVNGEQMFIKILQVPSTVLFSGDIKVIRSLTSEGAKKDNSPPPM